MIITLYKNCRLNKSYCEVLDTIAPHTYNGVEYANSLEAYLSTLPKKVFNTGTGTIYGTNSGKIPFELAQGEGLTMYDYNYMKIADETNNFVRYCFILSLQVADGSAIAEYEEDVWASYSATMHIRKSLLTRSRSLKYGNYNIPFYKLGMEYEGNNKLILEPLITSMIEEGSEEYYEDKCYIACQMQFYQLASAGEKTNVITRSVLLTRQLGTATGSWFPITASLNNFISLLKNSQVSTKFIFNQTYKSIGGIPSSQGDWYYEISNIIIIPAKFDIYVQQYTMGDFDITLPYEINVWDFCRSLSTNGSSTPNANTKPIVTTTFSIDADFKKIAIGTYTNTYAVEQNGSQINGEILCSVSDYEINLFLSFQNHLINITGNYVIDVPLSIQTADVTQQQKTARQLEIMNNTFGIGGGVLNLGLGINNIVTGVARTAFGAQVGSISSISQGYGEITGGASQAYHGITQTAKGIANLIVLNKPLYRTSKGTFSISNGMLNGHSGLFIFNIESDNDLEVQANIDNGGYVVNEVVDDILQDIAIANDKPAYNVMQFDFVNNYGAFPEDIRQRLVDILSNGFKIWYNTAEYIAS